MFFTHELLVGPRGRFSIIWRAATRKEKIKKRKLEALDVYETCQELLKYIRPSSDSRMGHIRGFSLRLSAQLVHGVIICYNSKVTYFRDEALSSWKIASSKRATIELLSNQIVKQKRHRSKSGDVEPEENFQLELNFDEDPMFGKMWSGMEEFPYIDPPHTTSEETTSPSSSENAKKRRKIDKNIVADVSQITMQEGVSTNFADASDFLMQGEAAQFQIDDFNDFASAPLLFDNVPTHSKQTRSNVTRQNVTTPAGAILPDQPETPTRPRRTAREIIEESVLAVPIQDEEQRSFTEHQEHIAGEQDVPPSTLFQEPPAVFITKKRKPKKFAVDPKIELTGHDIKKQFRIKPKTFADLKSEGALDEPMNFIIVSTLLSKPSMHGSSHDTELIQEASTEGTDVHSIYAKSIDDIEKNLQLPQTSDVEQDASRSGLMETMMDESSMQPVRDVSGFTDIEAPSMQRSTLKRSILDVSERSRRDRSLVPAEMSDITGGLLDMDASHVEMPSPDELSDQVPPIDVDMPSELNQYQEASVLENIEALCERDGQTSFSNLAPPRVTSRQEAAKRFYGLLACAKSRTVKITQEECFGEIWIEQNHSLM